MLHNLGHSIRSISQQLSISKQTVRRYAEEYPEIDQLKRGSTVLSPYPAYLHAQWRAGIYNTVQRFREIRVQGHRGSSRPARHWKTQMNPEKWLVSPVSGTQKQHKVQVWSARHIVRLMFKEHDTLTENQLHAPEQMPIRKFGRLILLGNRSFGCSNTVFQKPWNPGWQQPPNTDRRNCRTLPKVCNEIKWSNRQMDGQINRLKISKRQMCQ